MKKKGFILGILCIVCMMFAACKKEAPAFPPKLYFTATPTPEPEEVSLSADGNVTAVITGNSFESEWMGLKFKPSATVLQEIKKESINDVEITCLEFTWPLGMPQVQIVVDKLPEENMTEKEYLNGFLTNLRAAAEAQNAFLNILSSGKKKTLGGQEFTSVETILQKGDYVIYSKHYFMLKDNYSLGISILYNDNTEWCMPEVLDTFTAYE